MGLLIRSAVVTLCILLSCFSVEVCSYGTHIVKDGVYDGVNVGKFTSQLHAAVISKFQDDYPRANDTDILPTLQGVWKDMVDASGNSLDTLPFILERRGGLNVLDLSGDYQVDIPLNLPSMFVLKLNGSLTPAANFSVPADTVNPALVRVEGKGFTAILGGVISTFLQNATAVTLQDSHHIQIHGVHATGSGYGNAVVVVEGGKYNEVAKCKIETPGVVGTSSTIGVLVSKTKDPLVHDNEISQLPSHGIKVGTNTTGATIYSNYVHHNKVDGINIEGRVNNTFIHNNTCFANDNDGIRVAVKAVDEFPGSPC